MGFLFFVGVIATIIYFSTKSSKAAREKWQAAADMLQLNYEPGGFGTSGTITGLMGSNRVAVTTFTKGGGNSSQTYTKYEVQYLKSLPFEFKITREGALQNIGKVFGMQDIEVGDPAFDDRVLVNGKDPDAIIHFLTPELQQEIGYLVTTYPDVTITQRKITVNKPGKDADPSVIAHCVRRLTGFAEQLVHGPSSEAAVPEKKKPPVPPVIPVSAKDEDFLVIESFEPSLNPLTTANPVVPDPPGWTDLEEEPEIIEAAEPEVPEPEAELPPGAPVDLSQVAAALYGGDSGRSLLVTKLFAEEYQDRPVSGSGVLRRVNKFSYDPVFTNCTGVQATFDICELAGDYSKVKVLAVVKYDTAEFDALKARVGTSFPITGKLVAQDALMHQLFIETE